MSQHDQLSERRINKACYRSLHRYKYQLMKPYVQNVGVPGYTSETPYLGLQDNGRLEIKTTYAWDGPSGPTLDTPDFMRGSLVHDALYQLIRMEVLPSSLRAHADRLLREMCREDGMEWFRAWYVWLAIRLFGGSSAKPGTQKPDQIICVSRG